MIIKHLLTILLALALLSGCCNTSYKKGADNDSEMQSGHCSLMDLFEQNVGDRIYFSYDSSALSSEAQEQLIRQAQWLSHHMNAKVIIEGHCDERGTREYNLALGERRADAVQKFLIHHGVEASRLDTISYGKERPVAIGNTESIWRLNRRSVMVIQER